MRAGRRSFWPAESTVRLDVLLNPGVTTSIGQLGPLCGYKMQRKPKILLKSLLNTESILTLDEQMSPAFTKLFEL